MKRWIRRIVVLVVLAGIAYGGYAWYRQKDAPAPVEFQTAAVERGDIVSTIGATGTVEPEEVIDVGAQVAGKIDSFGKDESGAEIDYGSHVTQGTILAQIDDTLYAADVAQADAQLAQAKAGLQRAQADLAQLEAKRDQAQRDWDRAQRLGPSEALAAVSYDAYRAAWETAKANVDVGKAAIEQAKATQAQAQATLDRARRNLGYTTIRSPVDGVIIDRRVNIGQTVVASLNAPSLFLIAKDLRRMEVWVAVNEADIGSIHPGQPANFTVDAFPGREFEGHVKKVRLNASMTQNVVTYTVELGTNNSDRTLLPYLTANVNFEIARHEGVLTVPNAALRWTPSDDLIAPGAELAAARGTEKRHATEHVAATDHQGADGDGGAPPPASHHGKRGTLWVPDGKFVRPVAVTLGISDDIMTEVSGKDVSEGMQVVIGEKRPVATSGAAGGNRNPFAPQPLRGRRNNNR